jgi:hypothetical protein
MSCSSIFVADVAAALEALDVRDDATERRIMELLGVEPIEEAHAPNVATIPLPDDDAACSAAEPPPTHVPQSYRYIPSAVHSFSPQRAAAPALRLQMGGERLAIGLSERDEPPLLLTPLLRASSVRAILSASVSTEIVTGLDTRRAIGIIARREPFDRLPLKMINSVRRGVQLLLDKSGGMSPYLRDQAWLTGWMARVIGRQRMEIGSFSGVPQRGLHRGLKRLRAWHPPPRGTPILLLTDLGIGYPAGFDDAASADEWLAFAVLARRAECPVVAFVPYPPERWPPALRRAITILRWDRQLTAGRAAKRVASARR